MTTPIHNSFYNKAYFNLKSKELARQHRNKTSSQQKQVNKTIEGVVVNNFIKDEGQNSQYLSSESNGALNMDDICNTLVIPSSLSKPALIGEGAPSKENKKKESSILLSALPLVATAVALVGGGLGLTSIFQKSAASLNDKNILKAERLPILAMNMNIKQEPEFAAYMALRNPNKKTILAMLGVFLMSGLTLIGKSLVDGVKDIWVKKKAADADKKLQEELIDIETKTFRGKLDVVWDELSCKAKYFNDVLSSRQKAVKTAGFGALGVQNAGADVQNSIRGIQNQNSHNVHSNPFSKLFGFRGNNVLVNNSLKPEQNSSYFKQGAFNHAKSDDTSSDSKKFDIKNSPLALALLTGAALFAGIFMGKKMFKNIRAADSEIRKFVQNGTNEIEAQITSLVEKLKTVQNKDDGASELSRLKELLQIKRADSFEVQNTLKGIPFLSENDIGQSTLDIMTGIKSIYGDAPETLGGKIGQIQYYCYLDENRGHLYNWIMNPDNPFAAYLFLAFTTISAAGYSIKKAIEGVKEAAVIKENTNTERDLQERLIDVEIRNFKSKKQSAIEPLMREFNIKAASDISNEELKTVADNILLEIKNGPPFVYA